jgi:hypothetical protein
MTIEAMKQALDIAGTAMKDAIKFIDALKAENASLRKAIAEAEKQEPSGHFVDFAFADSIAQVHVYDQFTKGQAFYTHPQPVQPKAEHSFWEDVANELRLEIATLQDEKRLLEKQVEAAQPKREWVGLTVEDIEKLFPKFGGAMVRCVRAIEAKLKEKNT